MNGLQIFNNNDFGAVRTLEENGKVLFCGSDVAKALGYSRPNEAVTQHCKEDGTVFQRITDNLGRQQQAKFINEGNLYRLILNSKLPAAERFEAWVLEEVLPTMRKTGGYVSNDDMFIDTYLSNADEPVKEMFRTTLESVRAMNNKIEQDKPKVFFADAVTCSNNSILVGELAKLLKQNGYDTGEKRLYDWLRDNNYLMKSGSSKNSPTQRSIDLGLFVISENCIKHNDGSKRLVFTTRVTGKGQQYFINKLLNKNNQMIGA